VDYVRPPVCVNWTSDITTTAGRPFELKVRVAVDPSCAGRIGLANLAASVPEAPDLRTLARTAIDASGEISIRMVALRPGTYKLAPLVVSYQFSGNSALSSLVRDYLGAVTVRAGDVSRPLTQEVAVEKTVSNGTFRVGDTVRVELSVRSWGSALGRAVEVRDYLPGAFSKLQADELDTVKGVGEPGSGVALKFPNEKRWRFTLTGLNSFTYDMKVLSNFRGELGQAAVLLDGYVVNVSGRPALATGDDGLFVSRQYTETAGEVNRPIGVTLRLGSASRVGYYVAVEDTLPPGFEADAGSVQQNVRGEVQSCSIRGDRVTFFVNTLSAPMELQYRVVPTIPGALVAPPARLFPMYNEENVVFSSSAELSVSEGGEGAGGSSGAADAALTKAAGPDGQQRTDDGPAVLKPKSPPSTAAPGISEDEKALPDLWVQSVHLAGEARPGEPAVFLAEVRMEGFSTDIPLTVYAYIDGRQAKVESLRLSRTTEAFCINIEWKAESGPHLVRVTADPLDWVPESSESNNMLEVPFYVQGIAGPQAGPDLSFQAGLLAADGLLSFVLTAMLYGPARRALARRRAGGKRARGKVTSGKVMGGMG
jgi:hypothetical protein